MSRRKRLKSVNRLNPKRGQMEVRSQHHPNSAQESLNNLGGPHFDAAKCQVPKDRQKIPSGRGRESGRSSAGLRPGAGEGEEGRNNFPDGQKLDIPDVE